MKKKIWILTALGAACLAAGFFIGKHRKSQEPKEEIPDCGGCFNNCSLAAPGCRIGREKAEEYFSDRQSDQQSGQPK